VSHRERRPRRTEDPVPAVAEVARPLAPSASALLALQAGAGNQAVTRALHRFYEKPGATRSEFPKTAKNKLNPGWVQNERPPLDRILVQEDEQWYAWSQNKREWQGADAPDVTTAAVENEGEGEAETPPPMKEPAPPRRYPLPKNAPMQELEGNSGMSLSGSQESPVEMPGGALPDAFVEKMFGYLDTSSLLALRVASPWLLEHGSDALREHLHRRTKEHPKGRVGGTLSSMSSLGAKPLVEQYRDAVKARPTEKLVVAADKVNANTINTLTNGFRGAVTVHYNERTDRGRPDPRFHQVQGPYDQGTHGGVINSKMHNKLVVGEGAKGTKAEGAAKGDFLLSGSPNLTANAMGANIESAVLIRYPGIARLYTDYIERVKTRTTDDPKFSKALESFNQRDVVGIRAALAPFVDISKTLNAELQGADQITMRMYLVGSGEKHDTVGTLCDLAEARATVEVVVDDKEAARTPYVRQALRRLSASGVKVGGEVGKEKERPAPDEDPRGIMHDKMILAHYPKTNTSGERWTVMIGSSGLTRNVDQNWNYENLLIIDDKALFDSMMDHHRAAEPYRAEGIAPVDRTSLLGRACSLLEQRVYDKANKPQWARFSDVLADARAANVSRSAIDDAIVELGLRVVNDRGAWIGF